MSDIVLAKDGVDPRVVELAETIKTAQGPEIKQLQGWLEDWGVDPDPILLHDGEGNTERVPAPTGAQQRSYAGVRDAILGRPSSDAATPDQAVAVMAVLEAAVVSAREGRAVEPALTAVERAAYPGVSPAPTAAERHHRSAAAR